MIQLPQIAIAGQDLGEEGRSNSLPRPVLSETFSPDTLGLIPTGNLAWTLDHDGI
ncbi:MAG: hypothetical protein WBC57_13560 [Candidatus Acidiferrales bacterium]